MVVEGDRSTRRIGEVIESNTFEVVAQCYELYDSPPLGSLISIGSPPIYAAVKLITTQPLDPSRPILARGENATTEDEVYQDNPQIPRLLTTRFEGLLIGHQQNEIDNPYLPPLPPRVHSFVYTCGEDVISRITSDLTFLRLIVSQIERVSDDVIGAFIRMANTCQSRDEEFLLKAGRVLAQELSGDFPRLNSILRSVKPRL